MEELEQKQKAKTTTVEEEGKKIAIIAYLTIIGLLVAYLMNREKKHPFARYHIIQSLGLMATGLVLGALGMVPFLGWIVTTLGSLVLLYMWVLGLISAVEERERPLPFLGIHYEKWFSQV